MLLVAVSAVNPSKVDFVVSHADVVDTLCEIISPKIMPNVRLPQTIILKGRQKLDPHHVEYLVVGNHDNLAALADAINAEYRYVGSAHIMRVPDLPLIFEQI
jgi:hypothetical protein